MLNFLELILAKLAAASWAGYVATAVVATAVTGGSIVALSESHVVNVTSGLGQKVDLPFTFKPSALGTLDAVYGSLAAGASAALTGAGVQLPPLVLNSRITAVSNKIVAEAQADRASLQKLSDNVEKLAGFKPSEDAKAVVGTSTPTVLVVTTTPQGGGGPTATATNTPAPAATSTHTPTPTNTRTPTPTSTPSITVSPSVTPTPTNSDTPTPTSTPCVGCSPTPTATNTSTPTNTATPYVNCGTLTMTMSDMIPGGPGTSKTLSCTNVGAHPFTYTLTTTCTGGCNALWTDPTNGLQLAVDKGTTLRNTSNPSTLPGGNTNVRTGSIQVSNLTVATGVASNNNVNLVLTTWLPAGPTAPGPNALTPNPGNDLQGLSLTVTVTINASE